MVLESTQKEAVSHGTISRFSILANFFEYGLMDFLSAPIVPPSRLGAEIAPRLAAKTEGK
ncbi:hypothetical protein LB515_18185 [Mesorhizobium sp. CA15]|uniref:hypothetical protein n=1 Tax=Mesorhizobium sp. CA15 TaxID=2876641 RepID=UPI001CD0D978|nr:hypothetical protein [Mesorhizobium sp. CA15]MBZ9867306.1 hypothetical protein [Mesorhizobium sp. CA15]